MALFKKEKVQDYKQSGKKSNKKMFAIAGAVIVVAIVVLYSVFFLGVNQTTVSSPVVANITSNGTLFSINSNQYFISLGSISLSSAKAYVHINELPVFVNPLLNVTLTLNNITKVNSGSTYANIGIQLQSISANVITVRISPLFTSLQVAPDSQDIRVIQNNLYGNNQNPSSTAVTSVTTTGSSTTATGSSTATTTIANTTNQTALAIQTALKKDEYYGLITNFSIVYTNTTNCNVGIYNSTYSKVFGAQPVGTYSYDNVSPYVPYGIVSKSSLGNNGDYNVVFYTRTIDPYLNSTPALTIVVNPTTESTVNDTTSGAFLDLNYTSLKSNYLRATEIGGPCAADIP